MLVLGTHTHTHKHTPTHKTAPCDRAVDTAPITAPSNGGMDFLLLPPAKADDTVPFSSIMQCIVANASRLDVRVGVSFGIGNVGE